MPADIPVTFPAEPTVAIVVMDDDQVPPITPSERFMELLWQTDIKPDIEPAIGDGLIVTVLLTVAAPQELITIYSIVSIPEDTPVTNPPDTMALPLVVLHKPPEEASAKVIVEPVQTIDGPEIVPGLGNGFIVTRREAVAVPQTFVTEYFTVSTPADIPVTNPPETVAFALVTDHIPPGAISVKVVVAPVHIAEMPRIVPALGNGLIVTILLTVVVPQVFKTL